MYVRAQIGFPLNSTLPRDVATINPHYSIASTPQAFADALKARLKTLTIIGGSTTFTVKVYNAEGPPPHFPLGEASQGTAFTPTFEPNEIALCLSYYAQWNRPRFRGRLYIPKAFISGTAAKVPTSGQRDEVGLWANALGKGLPSGDYMGVWSRVNHSFAQVTNWFCDDEWDTVRSRGLRSTARTQGTF